MGAKLDRFTLGAHFTFESFTIVTYVRQCECFLKSGELLLLILFDITSWKKKKCLFAQLRTCCTFFPSFNFIYFLCSRSLFKKYC
jgi:hypothetical protein